MPSRHPAAGPSAAQAERILDARTALLAAPQRGAPAPLATAQVLACTCGGDTYALSLDAIAEILPARACVAVPGATAPVIGVSGLAGRLWSVVDLAAALGLGEAPAAGGLTGHLLRLRHLPRRLLLRVEHVAGVVAASPVADRPHRGMGAAAVTGYALAPAGSLAESAVLLGLLDPGLLLGPLLDSSQTGA
ncbi:chemotaxis protein CheW [Belnapia sp. T6]|uniref:Chemotaxis protein CheW n=1 Tax=Belnapia mucosa TaxID=2804532 RepID=A0ABS1V4T6_9PROT|nr:chemotaxis protein CheW [Belnapia mucosa]MBL6455719.1 chemotaxis protein CheW [Belnapia mucosa]